LAGIRTRLLSRSLVVLRRGYRLPPDALQRGCFRAPC